MAKTFNKLETPQTLSFNSIEAKQPSLEASFENLIPHNPVSPAENIHPKNAYSFMVEFTTKDGNGDVFDEPHTVDGPTGSFNNPLNLKVINGNIHGPVVVVPLNSKSSTGAYF